MSIQCGVDHLLAEHLPALRNQRIGLVTNNAATTAAIDPLTPTRLALQRAGIDLVALFSPEHGLNAAAADGAAVGHGRDALTAIPVNSLYGATYRPTARMLDGIDLLLFDIPDIGARFYTYIWTLSYVLEACAKRGLPLWVLDRPNPLGGDLADAEGPMLDEANISTFVGRWSMPVRHSLTAGELAQLWNAERALNAVLTVVTVRGWQRQQHWPELGVPFVPTSPAMPSYETALLYPGTCFGEGTNLSEGRGTATPLRVVGAPWLDGVALADAFNQVELPGIVARAVTFAPSASKYAREPCRGVMLHVTDRYAVRPVAAGLHLLYAVLRLHPDEFAWLPYPTAANVPGYGHFDRLVGRLDLRNHLTELAAAAADPTPTIHAWTQTADWTQRVTPHLLYA